MWYLFVVCCARAANGHAAAEPTIPLMKSRRRIAFPRLGLRRIGRDYSRDLRSTKWGSGIKLHSSNSEPPMSALGQKQTSRHLQPMSALPPKADIAKAIGHVRFVPISEQVQSPTRCDRGKGLTDANVVRSHLRRP